MNPARSRWAAALIAVAEKPLYEYGSPEWLALPEGSPAKIAAVVVAAESWARAGDELEDRLRAELLFASEAHKAADDAEYLARAAAHRRSWTGEGFRPDPVANAEIDAEWSQWAGEAS